MEPTISFLIPSYNVAQYLPKCLDSFLCENVLDNLEVIVVNDGSTDGTADVAGEYAKKHPDIFRIMNKENGGHGSAINVGAKAANGKYFKVVDADDWVLAENLPEFVRSLERTDADVALTPYHMVDAATGRAESRHMYVADYGRAYTLGDINAKWKDFDRCLMFHGITYRRDFYLKAGHELPEKIFYEDQEYSAIPFCHAASVAAFDLPLYQYRVGDSEQSVSSANQVRRIGELGTVITRMAAYLAGHGGHIQADSGGHDHADSSNYIHADSDFRASEVPEKCRSGISADGKLRLSPDGREFLAHKLEMVILSYYRVACVLETDKKAGRAAAAALTREVCGMVPDMAGRLGKKPWLYRLLSVMHVSESRYDRILQSGTYRRLRHNHEREFS